MAFKAWLISLILESCYEKNGFDIIFIDQHCLKKKGRVALVGFDNLDICYLVVKIHLNFLTGTKQTNLILVGENKISAIPN